ncbi:MAG TPA: D-alanine--D-alanine ligase [Egibacteraceae bacterium]|nr:D-alanine--D-alanine ligase [Egibacteraceae bacterium]
MSQSVSVAVLAGGLSLERDVSLRSGRRVAEALADRGHRVRRLDLDEGVVSALAEGEFDVAYLALHGKAGEDGAIQGLLELLGIPYTGPGPIASALAWDKVVMKGLLRRAGLHTPDWAAVSAEAIRSMGAARALDRIEGRLGSALIVKPGQGGAAMGVRYVEASQDLAPALVAAYSYHDVALIERYIAGTEIAVSVVDGQALPPVEIHAKEGAYDFAARYTHGATEFHAPARLDADVLQRCQEAAVRAYEIAGCRHVTRADVIVDSDGLPWVFELDTCPGMTETSLLPMAAGAAGWTFDELCERIVRLAVADGPAA